MSNNTSDNRLVGAAGVGLPTQGSEPDPFVDPARAAQPVASAQSATPSRPAMPETAVIDSVMRLERAAFTPRRTRSLRSYMYDENTSIEQMHETYRTIILHINAGQSDAEISRLLGFSASHIWQVRNSPAGRAVLAKAAKHAELLMAEVRLELAQCALDAAKFLGQILRDGQAMGYSPTQILEVAKYCVELADRVQPAEAVSVSVPGDLARMRLMMEMNRAECAQSENRGGV